MCGPPHPSPPPFHSAVFLDRDGVLNEVVLRDGKPFPPPSLEALVILPGVPEALLRLRAAGYLTIVATNQPDIVTGKTTEAIVDAIHRHMLATLALDAIEVCACVEGPGCDCYKPKPGLLLRAARARSIDLLKSFMVGDRWRDVGAGRAAGCRTIFIDRGYRERRPEAPDHTVADLAAAADIILGTARRPGSPIIG